MLALFLLASVAAQSTIVDTADPPRLFAWPSVSMGTRLDDGAQGAGALSLSYRLTDWLEPEMLAMAGGYGSAAQRSLEMVDRFSFGARFVWPIERVRPFLWLALHHEHQTELSALAREPVAATLGLSHAGVQHYTGGEAAIGTSLPWVIDGTAFETMARVGVVALPAFGARGARDQVALFVDVGAGLPLSL